MSRIVDLNRYIDQTLLSPTCTQAQIIDFCEEAIEYEFRTVCIPPYFVKLAFDTLVSSNVEVCTVIGFPLGYNTLETKKSELIEAINNGASELDIVLNQILLKSDNSVAMIEEMNILNEIAHKNYAKTKWIVETAYLDEDELVNVCRYCMESGADFIKTSTGFAGKGAQLEHVKLWKKLIGNNKLQIKASGGIKNKADAFSFIAAGADRLGCSAGVKIIKEK